MGGSSMRPRLVHPDIFNKLHLKQIKTTYTQYFYIFLAIFLIGGISVIYYKYLVRRGENRIARFPPHPLVGKTSDIYQK